MHKRLIKRMDVKSTFELPGFCNFTDRGNVSDHHHGATIVSPLMMCFAGAIGNILALIVLHRTRSNTVFYTLVGGLAWTDLTGIVLTTPVTILAYLNNREWVGGDILCKFNGFVMICFGLSTPLIVCAMAIERFLAVKCAFVHSQRCNFNCARIILVVLWIVVMIFGILPLFGFGRYVVQYPCTWCFLDFHSKDSVLNAYGYLYASVNLTVVMIMTSCNGYVMFTLLRVRYLKRVAEAQNGNLEIHELHGSKRIRKKKKRQRDIELQMIVLMCAITTVFAVCWAPLMVQIVVTITTGIPNYVIDLTAIRLASLNQTLDPWLYILLRKSFITKIKQYCKRLCCNCVSNSSDSDDAYDQNAHAHHLRCFRKHYNVAAGHQYMCHFKNIPPAAMCMNVQYKKSSKSKSSDKDSKPKKLSLPDVMRDTDSRTPLAESRPDVADLENYEDMCKQCQSIHARHESKSTFDGDGAYVNIILMAKSDNSNSSEEESDKSSTSQHCNICSGVDDSQFNDVFSEAGPETLESELFLTKTTSSNDELGTLSSVASLVNRRKQLKSEVIPSPPKVQLSSKRKRRIKSVT